MTAPTIAYACLTLLAVAALPLWPWSRSWDFGNAGAIALTLLVISINASLGQALA
jgi:hypothetical protein